MVNPLVVVMTPDSFSVLHLGEAGPKKTFFVSLVATSEGRLAQ